MTAASSLRRELMVIVPVRTRSETNMREHWRARHARRKDQRQKSGWMMLAALRAEGIGVPCVVTLTRIAPSRGLDDDNLRGALKAVRDGVSDALGVDDRDPRVTWLYGQRRGSKEQWAVEIAVSQA